MVLSVNCFFQIAFSIRIDNKIKRGWISDIACLLFCAIANFEREDKETLRSPKQNKIVQNGLRGN